MPEISYQAAIPGTAAFVAMFQIAGWDPRLMVGAALTPWRTAATRCWLTTVDVRS